jgi:pimeloyl-ACP methyl ester carboxylesterase
MDALKLKRPVLAGHSIAGVELSSVALLHPDRIAGLVYLEAGYPYAFYDGAGPTTMEFQRIQGPQPPTPGDADLSSFGALQNWDERVYGFRTPEAELRQLWVSASDGRPLKPRDPPGSQVLMTIVKETKRRTGIAVPALVIFANPHVPEEWINGSTDPLVRKAASAYFTELDALTEKQVKAFAGGVPSAHVISLPGAHYIFLSNEADVLREMSAFLTSLK